MDLTLIPDLAIALGLGLLVGIERQRHAGSVAGIRTFAMITLLGALAAALGTVAGNVVVAVGLGAVAALLITGNLLMLRSDTQDPGMTTEVAALVMFAVGAMTVAGYRIQAFVVAGSVALLLHWKRPLHGLVRALGEADFHAVMRLVLIGLVILPMLPDRAWGPYDVLNPFRIWMMVVLIVGISLAAWVAMRLFGARAGTIAAGALGGLISSTAATVGYARRARAGAGTGPIALMIMLASTVVFVRVLVEIIVVDGPTSRLAPPVIAMAFVMAGLCVVAWRWAAPLTRAEAEAGTPGDLGAAIVFGLLYGGILFLVAAVRERFGTGALYIVAGVSGLTDVDAITLSTAHLVNAGRIEPATGWRLIMVAALANLVFKGAAVAALGSRRLFVRVAVLFGAGLLGGGALIALWPG